MSEFLNAAKTDEIAPGQSRRFQVRVEGDHILIGVEAAVPDAGGAAARAALPEEAR